jgi:hypothetical protein
VLDPLPRDLDVLGDRLTAAVARRRDQRKRAAQRRRRLAIAVVVGALVLATLTPAQLGPAQRHVELASSAAAEPLGCNQPRGARFTLPGCAAEPAERAQPTILPRRPVYAWR